MSLDTQNHGTPRQAGLTTTVPVEIIFAAGWRPVDLNNIFITHPGRLHFALEAEKEGLPRTICGWNKGVLVAALSTRVERVVEVVQGDCTTSELLGQELERRGIPVTPFAYPFSADAVLLQAEMETFASAFETNLAAAEGVWRELLPVRQTLHRLDELTWQTGLVSGFENHLHLVSGSDLLGDPALFHSRLEEFMNGLKSRMPFREKVRLGYIGVPPMIDDLYNRIEEAGGRVVFNEVQRQFAMCEPATSLLEQYRQYTYPYSINGRVADIRRETGRRQIQGLIHYVQSFCFHQLEDQIFRRELDLPVLTLEADRPGPLDSRDRVRLESFIRMLKSPARTAGSTAVPGCYLGVDLGSRWVKLVLMAGTEIVFRERTDTIQFYRRFARRNGGGFELCPRQLAKWLAGQGNLSADPKTMTVCATGYGRYLFGLGGAGVVPELHAHTAWACSQLEQGDFTLLDIGGQDTKIIQVRNGEVVDFAMNDRCAAGGGRYLENMAGLLGLEVQELGRYYQRPVPLSATCATFGESEVVGRIVEGIPLEEICAGINYTVFQRVLPDLLRLASGTLAVTGGVAHNEAVLHFLRTGTPFREVLVPADAQYAGALGAILTCQRLTAHTARTAGGS